MSTDLEVYEQPATLVMRPVGSPAEIKEAFDEYQAICASLLDKSDYQTYEKWNPETRRKEPAQFKKRSAWRKLANAMGVTFEILSKEKERDEQGRTFSAEFVVRATHPNGRYSDGWGNCHFREKCTDRCVSDCNGFKHFSKPEHDIPATAETRAKNRAAADLFGLGEVSAEEMGAGEPRRRSQEEIEDAELVTSPTGEIFPDQRPVDSPFTPPAGAAEAKPKGDISEAQRKMIWRLLKKLVEQGKGDEETLKGELLLAYGVASTSELTKSEASQVIEGWKKRAGEES